MADHLVVTSVDDDRWARLVGSSPAVTPFHHPAWAGLLADCYGFRSLAVGVVDGSGTMTAGLPVIEIAHPLRPRRWVSLPFSDSCEPLATDEAALRSLVTLLDDARAAEGAPLVEVRAWLPPPATSVPSGAVIHRRGLPAGLDALRAGVHPSHRRNIGLAAKRGVVVRRGEHRRDLAEVFYDLHVGTRRRHGVPVQPRRYFGMLWDRLLAHDLGLLLLAEVDGRPVAGGVFLAWGGTVVHKYAASDPIAWRRRANDLLMWEGLAWAVEQGCRRADLGRTDVANEGLRAFKHAWGGEEEPLAYSALGPATADRRGRLAELAEPVLRHGPRWLTRAAGEVLYRYAA